jgi:hypothetical protein
MSLQLVNPMLLSAHQVFSLFHDLKNNKQEILLRVLVPGILKQN